MTAQLIWEKRQRNSITVLASTWNGSTEAAKGVIYIVPKFLWRSKKDQIETTIQEPVSTPWLQWNQTRRFWCQENITCPWCPLQPSLTSAANTVTITSVQTWWNVL